MWDEIFYEMLGLGGLVLINVVRVPSGRDDREFFECGPM